jgi:hypothetical protein
MAHRKHSSIKASYIRNTHNFLLVWLDLSTNGSYKIACPDAITQFRQTTNSIKLFTNVDQCIDYITDITEEKAFIILSGAIVRSIVSIVQDICQINSIYIWCDNVSAEHEQWTNQWTKDVGEVSSRFDFFQRIFAYLSVSKKLTSVSYRTRRTLSNGILRSSIL